MEYSLQTLNQTLNLENLTVKHLTDKLNLIGLEIDDIVEQKISTNIFLDDSKILVKIPANREELLNEKDFINEFSSIFLIKIYNLWQKTKENYSFLLKNKYISSKNYSIQRIESKTKNILTYSLEIQNIKNLKSSSWVIKKLRNLGISSVNSFTDLLNIVSNEWGQTINFFISDQKEPIISNLKINYLTRKELFSPYNGKSYELQPGTIVLSDNKGKIFNVLGIINTTIDEKYISTERIFLDATFYDIHQNYNSLNSLNTKLSFKYLRKSFFQNFKYTFQRLLTLLEIITSCTIVPIKYCTFEENIELKTTRILKFRKKNMFLFFNNQEYDMNVFLKAGLKIVCETKSDYYFLIPTSRNDLTREIDLIEEYCRFIGYKNFDLIFPVQTISSQNLVGKQKNRICNFFFSYGFSEILTNPLNDFEKQKEKSVLILNPLTSQLSSLRYSSLSKILETFELNSKLNSSKTNFFEIGRTFKIKNNKIIEQDKIAGIFQIPFSKKDKQTETEWFIAKGFMENILSNFRLNDLDIRKIEKYVDLFHPTRSITFLKKKKKLGIFGELNPLLVKQFYAHVRGKIYIFEFDLNFLNNWQIRSQVNLSKEYSKYPPIIKDLSIQMNKNINFDQLKKEIFNSSNYLKNVTFFDIYFEENKEKVFNLGIRLEFRSKEETLKNEVIEKELMKIREFLDIKLKI